MQAADKAARAAILAPRCPTPTADAKAEQIAGYIEQSPPSKGLDVLATEWERLDDGARICRKGSAL